MTENNLTFAKIVANPTPYGWSQVYSAGKLFAAISLERQIESEEKDFLNVLGKEILNTLEQEFFTLETKDLDSIRQAILETQKKIPEEITLSFVIGSTVNNILYLYILGNGKVDIKRKGHLGTLLHAIDQENKSLKEASGLLEENDILVLQTKQFSEVVSESTLSEFLDNPEIPEAAENLAPLVHEKENPGAAAILVNYKEAVKNELFESAVKDEPTTPISSAKEEDNQPFFNQKQSVERTSRMPKFSLNILKFPKISEINRSKKIILAIVVVVVIVFGVSLFLALNKQGSEKLTLEFNNVYPKAEKKYEEGNGLVDLNQELAKDSFTQAKNLLENAKDKFVKDSPQEKQILTLLAKVNEALQGSAKSTNTTTVEAKANESTYLFNESKNSALDYTKDDKNIYLITTKSISSIPSGDTDIKTLIKNDTDWKTVGGLATYNTNMYVLDKDSNQILKFLNNGAAYSKSDYLNASTKADFTKAVSITIDNNIYVLFSDGTVEKYFKGNLQDFSLKGLNKALLNPIKIYSTPDFDNIYILDKGNSRIVKIDKTGAYTAEYSSPVIKNATDFEILETDKKAYILSSGKLYKLSL